MTEARKTPGWKLHLNMIFMQLFYAFKLLYVCHREGSRRHMRKQSRKDLAITLKWAARELASLPFGKGDGQGPETPSIRKTFLRVVETHRDPAGKLERKQARLELAYAIRRRVQPVIDWVRRRFGTAPAAGK